MLLWRQRARNWDSTNRFSHSTSLGWGSSSKATWDAVTFRDAQSLRPSLQKFPQRFCLPGCLSVSRFSYQNRWGDWVIRSLSFVGNSIPNFFAALLLLYIFAIQLQWLPVISRQLTVESVILPASTLALAMSAKYIRQVRATVLDELSKDYVLAARARGIPFAATLIFSVLRSSLVTIITLLMLSIGSLLGGTAIVESIFMWDGVGKLAVDAINMRDYPMIQAYVMWMAIIYVCVNLMTDLSYQWLDPRIRLGRGVS